MPVALEVGPKFLNVTFLDAAGEKRNRRYQLDPDYDPGLDEVVLLADLNSLQALTDAVIISCDISQSYIDTSAPAVSPNPSNVIGDAAILSISLSTPGKTAPMSIPAPVIGIFGATTGKLRNQVDPADAAVVAWVNKFKASAAKFSLSDGEFANETTPVIGGYRQK